MPIIADNDTRIERRITVVASAYSVILREYLSSYLLLTTCPIRNWDEMLQEFTRAAMRTALIDMCIVPRHIISTCRELDLARSPSSIVVEISRDDMLVSVVRKKDISNESLYLSKEVFIFCLVGRSFSIRR